jgi:hypothetical protein
MLLNILFLLLTYSNPCGKKSPAGISFFSVSQVYYEKDNQAPDDASYGIKDDIT